jgi:hypothetical protein
VTRSDRTAREQERKLSAVLRRPGNVFIAGFITGARYSLAWLRDKTAVPPAIIAEQMKRLEKDVKRRHRK